MRKICCFAAGLLLCASAAGAAFNDVPQSHWAHSYVEKMTDEGIIQGRSKTVFAPEDTLTRAEFLTLLVREQKLETASRQDGEAWWRPYYNAALSGGLLENGEWAANESTMSSPAPRAEMARLMERILEKQDRFAGNRSADFSDLESDTLNSTDRSAIEQCAAAGFLKGYNDGSFRPFGSLTRAEAATVLARLNAADALPEDAQVYAVKGQMMIAYRADYKGTDVYGANLLTGETDHYYVPMDFQLAETDYAEYYHGRTIGSSDGTHFWGKAGLYVLQNGHLAQITDRVAAAWAQDAQTGAYYVLTTAPGDRVMNYMTGALGGDEVICAAADGTQTTVLARPQEKGSWDYSFNYIHLEQDGVHVGVNATYTNQPDDIRYDCRIENGKLRVVTAAHTTVEDVQSRLDLAGVGVGA